MYKAAPGVYYGMSLNGNGFSGLGDIPPQFMPATDAQVAGWCAAQGIPDGYCPYTPGMINYSGGLVVVTDPSGVPCTSDPLGTGPCTMATVSQSVDKGILSQLGIALNPISDVPSSMTTPTITAGNGRQYFPLSAHPNAAQLTQAQTLALLNALFPAGASTPAPSTTNVQGVYSDANTAQAIASQITGGTVVSNSDGSYSVVAPGNAVATPAQISQISSQPAPAGSSGSVPGPTFYPSTTPGTNTTPTGTTPTGTTNTKTPAGGSSGSGSMFCFPGDPSGPIMPGVPVCQYTALGVLGLLALAIVLK